MADGSKKEGKMIVKKPKEQDDTILSDSGDSEEEHSQDIHCDVCNKDISGYRSYLGHLKGSVHTKNVKKQKLKEQLKDMPEVLLGDHKESGSEEDDKPYARCALCEKAFSGPESLNKHLKSAAHKKKVKSSQSLETLKAKYAGDNDDEEEGEFFSKCHVCQKSFSGHVPFKIHMASSAHKKSLDRQKVAEEVRHLTLTPEDTSDGYVCRECRKVFRDPMAFKSHLQNNSHEKRKAKDLLKEFLAAYPEILFVTPLDKADSDDSDADDSQYYLICKLCNMSFTGPESAQDHVRSKKHANLKKEKKILKMLKEQSGEKNKAAKDSKSAASGSTANGKVKSSERSGDPEDFELI